MTAFAALTLSNHAAVAVPFTPQSIDSSGVAKWIDGASVFDAKKTVTQSVTLPKGKSPVSRLKQKIVMPIMDPLDATKKIGENYVNVEYVFAKQASQTDRRDLRAFLADLTGETVTVDAVDNLAGVY